MDWYADLMDRTDFLGRPEPRRNDELHAWLKFGGKLSEFKSNAPLRKPEADANRN